MLIVRSQAYEAMLAHAREDYPHECCGLLVGRVEGERRLVESVRRARNLNVERAHDRFELDPQDYLRVDRELRGTGLEIVGFYHSHPDHPARPSQYDAERAFPSYSYIIISVEKGTPVQARSWVFDEANRRFDEEGLEVRD